MCFSGELYAQTISVVVVMTASSGPVELGQPPKPNICAHVWQPASEQEAAGWKDEPLFVNHVQLETIVLIISVHGGASCFSSFVLFMLSYARLR